MNREVFAIGELPHKIDHVGGLIKSASVAVNVLKVISRRVTVDLRINYTSSSNHAIHRSWHNSVRITLGRM